MEPSTDNVLAIAVGVLIIIGLVVVIGTWVATNINQATGGSLQREPPPLTTMTGTAYYRTRDGTEGYQFRFSEISRGNFRIYILSQPGPAHGPHRLRDRSGDYICWSVPITTYEDAKKIAQMWAEATEEYRKTGKLF